MARSAAFPTQGRKRLDVLVALATAVAAGASPAALHRGFAQLDLPAYRNRPVVLTPGEGPLVIDDGMAATPSKTAAALAAYPDYSVVLIAGGVDDLGAGPVHATPEEQELLERACDAVARSTRFVVLFGPAADRLEPLLAVRRVRLARAGGLEEAELPRCQAWRVRQRSCSRRCSRSVLPTGRFATLRLRPASRRRPARKRTRVAKRSVLSVHCENHEEAAEQVTRTRTWLEALRSSEAGTDEDGAASVTVVAEVVTVADEPIVTQAPVDHR